MKKTRKLLLPLIFVLLTASVLLLSACTGKCQHQAGNYLLIEKENKIISKCALCSEEIETLSAAKLTDAYSTAWATNNKSEVDLTSFALVYKSDSKNFISDVNNFATSVLERTGINVTPVTAKQYKSADYAGAIFIGDTGLKESEDAKKILEAGYSYAVTASGKDIAVVGRTADDITAALNFIVANYLTSYTNKVSFPVCTLGMNPRFVEIAPASFYIVIDNDTYDTPGHAYVSGSNKECTDYSYRVTQSFAKKFGLENKIIKESHTLPNCAYVSVFDGKDYEERTQVITDETTHLIFFGEVDHPASVAFRANLPANCHGFKIIDEYTVVIAAHNDIGLEKAAELFRKEYMASKDKVWATGYTSIEVTDSNWIVDFPRPASENIRLYNTQASTADTLQLLYTGSGISEKAFDDYCETLKLAGYKLYGSVTQFAENKFATFINESKNSVLHVAYNPFAHQNDVDPTGDGLITTQNMSTGSSMVAGREWNSKSYTVMYPAIKYDPCIRIISAPLDAELVLLPESQVPKPFGTTANTLKVKLPAENLLTKDYSYKKVTETSITAVGLPSGSIGTCYVIQLEDGSFIIIDGGASSVDLKKQNDEGDALYRILSKLHENAFADEGEIPKAITVRAWYLTHSHWDHYGAFTYFMYQYGNGFKADSSYLVDQKYRVNLQNVIAHVATLQLQNMNKGFENVTSATMIAAMQYANGGGANFIRAHAGQVIHFANVTLEVLMTPEDFNPIRISNTNDMNTIINFKISSKDDPDNEVEFLSSGDSCLYQGRYLIAAYGDYLKSDMVTMAHHGNIGTDSLYYETIQPKVVWYPNSVGSFVSYSSSRSNNWPYNVSKRLVEMDCLKYIYVSGEGASYSATNGVYLSGIAGVTVKFQNATPLYDAPCDIIKDGALIDMKTTPTQMGNKYPVYKNPNYKEK